MIACCVSHRGYDPPGHWMTLGMPDLVRVQRQQSELGSDHAAWLLLLPDAMISLAAVEIAATITIKAAAVLIMPLGCSISFLRHWHCQLLVITGKKQSLHEMQARGKQVKLGLHLHEVVWVATIDLLGCNAQDQVHNDQSLRQYQRACMECPICPGHPKIKTSCHHIACVQHRRDPRWSLCCTDTQQPS